jgi:hypothetical protein
MHNKKAQFILVMMTHEFPHILRVLLALKQAAPTRG